MPTTEGRKWYGQSFVNPRNGGNRLIQQISKVTRMMLSLEV